MGPVVVLFHSAYGHTQRMAQAVEQGARDVAQTQLIAIDAQGELTPEEWQALDHAAALIMGAPTYMHMVSWQFKKWADTSSKAWMAQAWKDKIFAGFTSSASMNGGKEASLNYMLALAMQHGGIWAGLGLLPSNNLAAKRNDVNYLGSSLGAMATTPSDASVAQMLAGDLESARLFGTRVAQVALRWSR